MTEDPAGGTARARSRGRPLALAVVGLLLAALALWGASRGTWLTATWDVPVRGRVVTTALGADVEPVLGAWAVLALAAIGGLLATSGWGRRVVGAIVALAGIWALVRAVTGLVGSDPSALPAAARQPGRLDALQVTAVWPVLAAVGGLLLVATGVLVALRAGRMPRLGARYDAPAGRGPGGSDDDERGLWEALDAGEDPTVGPGRAPDRAEGGRG
jgi:uncharacterized membrane protein (TIGR02234 family)